MVKVSVIIPVYNVENYLRACLDSVISQTLKDIEIIIVDDGSKDVSGSICDEYEKLDKRIQVIHQENQYVGVARNNGMKRAVGEYLIFLDSDDYFDSGMLKALYDRAKETDADITICRERAYFEKESEFGKMDWALKNKMYISKNVFSGEDIPDNILTFCVLWPWDKLYKREFLESTDIKFPSDRAVAASEDLVFVGHTVSKAKRITCLDDIFITHRYHSKSLAATRKPDTASIALKMLEERLKKEGLFDKYKKSFMNLALDHLCWSLSVASKKTYKEEYNIARKTFKYFGFSKYKSDYFSNKQQYSFYLQNRNIVSKYVIKSKSFLKKTKLILDSLYI